ncbi:carboxymethylenebutenolidase [Caballeronia humi]|uniref:Carboxymethylenebutenolidase n=1 Tax=Caballeronia humi TaxID=326474 RepID=A0A158H4Y4_9BURK|nr:carboxymethylenebutenolidase [Caballeronia humi]
MLKPEVDSLVPHVPFDRRSFIKATIGTGFAAAVLPVSAQTITTDTEGLEAGAIGIRAADGTLVPAYRAQPKGKTKLPVIIVVHEIFGVHEHIADVCRRFAKLGYLAIAPEFFIRQGDPASVPSIQQINDQIASKVPDSQVLSDVDAAVVWAGEHGGDVNKLGITGFCWGGRIAWLYAEHNPAREGGRRVVRAAHRPEDRQQAELPDRQRGAIEGAGARSVRTSGPEHPAGHDRGDEAGDRERSAERARLAIRRVRRCAARVLR